MPFPSSNKSEASNIVKQITRLTTSLSYKFGMGTAHDRTILTAAISILTQAMVIAESNPSDALRLYTAAMKTANLSGKQTK